MSAAATRVGSTDDYKLMEGIAARDANAFRALYDRHSPLVFALCLRVLRDRAASEDLLIDVFFELWDKADRYDPSRGSPVTYLIMLARSRAIDRKRGMPRIQASSIEADVISSRASDNPSGDLLASERAQVVKRALAELEPQQRQAIECSFYDGLSHSEIADRLSKPLGTVKTYIRQGLIRMREKLRTSE